MTTRRELTVKTGALTIVFVLALVSFSWDCFGQAETSENSEELRIGSIEAAGNITISKAMILASVRARVGE